MVKYPDVTEKLDSKLTFEKVDKSGGTIIGSNDLVRLKADFGYVISNFTMEIPSSSASVSLPADKSDNDNVIPSYSDYPSIYEFKFDDHFTGLEMDGNPELILEANSKKYDPDTMDTDDYGNTSYSLSFKPTTDDHTTVTAGGSDTTNTTVHADTEIKVTADSGYRITRVNLNWHKEGSSGGFFPVDPRDQYREVREAWGYGEYTFNINGMFEEDSGDDLKVSVESEEGEPVFTDTPDYDNFNENLSKHISSNITDDSLPDDNILKLDVDKNYRFDKEGVTLTYLYDDDTETAEQYTMKKDGKPMFGKFANKFEIDLSNEVKDNSIRTIKIKASAETVGDTIYSQKIEHATSNISVEQDKEAPELEKGKVDSETELVLTADEGYAFKDSIKLTYGRSRNPNEQHEFFPNDDTGKFSKDNTVFTQPLGDYWKYDTHLVKVEAIAKEVYTGGEGDSDSDTTAFANVYKVDNTILSKISSERFQDIKSVLPNGDNVTADMGNYIYNVYKFPFKIDNKFISTDKSSIQMGYHSLSTKSKTFLKSRIKFDLGTIQVPETYRNVYDYKGVECLLHVPYAEPIVVDKTYVIGSSIQIAYFLDLYTGTVTMDIYSDKINGGLVQRQDIPMSYEIPFIQPRYNDVQGSLGRYINNTVETPYIEVIRPVPYDDATMFGKEGKEYGKLKEFEGYVEVSDIDIVTNATKVEKNRIEQLLSNGATIKLPDNSK